MKFISIAITTIVLSSVAENCFGNKTTSSRPNIVLVMSDDQGWVETGYNGHPYLKTPVLDEMAAQGLRFDRFYAASSLCTPTRASIMTGRHANRCGAFSPNLAIRPEEITLAQILQQAGYATGHFGKWHLGPVKAESPVNPNKMGFDQYLSHDNFFEMDPMLSLNGAAPIICQGEGSAVVVDAAIDFIKKIHAEEKPFFTVIWFGSPHEPYSGLPEDIERYSGITDNDFKPGTPGNLRLVEITAMDRAIGKFRQALRELNVSDNTLIWFNSDNGIGFNEGPNGLWRGRKSDIYQGGHIVPGILEWPAVIKTSRTTSVHCVTTDIMPTLLDLLGLQYPEPDRPLDGISLRKLIVEDAMTYRPQPIGYWSIWGQQKPVQKFLAQGKSNGNWMPPELLKGTTPLGRNTGQDDGYSKIPNYNNWKFSKPLTDNFPGDAAWLENQWRLVSVKNGDNINLELYNIQEDPGETYDISTQYPEIVERMLKELKAWQVSIMQSLSGKDYTSTKVKDTMYVMKNVVPTYQILTNQADLYRNVFYKQPDNKTVKMVKLNINAIHALINLH